METIKIIPLGGVRENGKNMYIAEVGEDIFVLDCGVRYPENELLGIDTVIPDFTYLEENADRVAGVFLTHGHADAIGALPYFLENVPVPVFGTELTIELAKLTVAKNEAKISISLMNIQKSILVMQPSAFSGQRIRFLILSESASKPALEISSIQGISNLIKQLSQCIKRISDVWQRSVKKAFWHC